VEFQKLEKVYIMDKRAWFLLSVCFFCAGVSRSATYYIDYDSGSDASLGTSAAQSWKRCPGDTNATETAASSVFAGGDTVIFKGGVHYRGEVVCKWSGTGARIVYDGNTSNAFGSGRAVIDGSNPFTGWTACTSAGDAGGSTNWSRLYKVTVPAGIDVFTANMYQGTNMLWPAQNPDVSDSFYPDDLSTFTSIYCDQVSRTNLTDVARFVQADSNYYAGCYIRLWGNPNKIYIRSITGYVPEEHKITFADTGESSLYTNKTVYYALVNHINHLNTPGEYSISTNGIMYLWPSAGNPATNAVGLSTRRRGIDINGKSNLDIQGFLIQKMTGGAGETTKGCGIVTRLGGSNITIRDNEITRNYSYEKEAAIRMYGLGASVCTNVLIENNSVYENPNNPGILVTLNDSIVRNNTLRKNGGTAIDFYTCKRSQLLGNTVTEHTGVHANGLTLYLGCEDCLVAYNTVFDGLVALTLQDAFRITVAYNVLHTAEDGPTATDWSSTNHLADGIYYYNNVMLNSYGKALGIGGSKGITNVIVRNNILDGCAFNPTNTTYSHNIYTSLGWNQAERYGWALGAGESVVSNKSLLFVDPTNRNFHTKIGSPAIDAATNLGLATDHGGQPVPAGTMPDIGAYEYWIHLADSDTDSMTDDWETQYFGNATNANPSAPAANGINTVLETYVAGLNPTNPSSVFRISDFRPLISGNTLQWQSVSGRVYSVCWTTNLLNTFQPLETNILWPQNGWTDAAHGAEPNNFYRLKVRLGP
jgi:hypothetical protein